MTGSIKSFFVRRSFNVSLSRLCNLFPGTRVEDGKLGYLGNKQGLFAISSATSWRDKFKLNGWPMSHRIESSVASRMGFEACGS